jgi:potassium large conductance calcium-activated channel subfamily M alpha protein 1
VIPQEQLNLTDTGFIRKQYPIDSGLCCRPTSRASGGNNMNNNGGLQVGIADDQAKDFDFEKTEMKYDSTGMFHWGPAKSLEECILVRL